MKRQAFTYFEMLIVLAIISIFSFFMSITMSDVLINEKESELQIELLEMVQRARHEAQMKYEEIVFCGSSDKKNCDGAWLKNWMLFMDNKGDKKIHHPQQLISLIQPTLQEGSLWLRTFPRHQQTYLRFSSDVMQNRNGAFWYCGKKSPHARWAVWINRAGRARLDRNSRALHHFNC